MGGACPLQGIMPAGKGTPGQEVRVLLAFHVLMPLGKCKKCGYALRESSKAWQVIWVFPDEVGNRWEIASSSCSRSVPQVGGIARSSLPGPLMHTTQVIQALQDVYD